MKVVHRDERAGSLKLLVETIDDLWHLHHVIKPGDVVSAVTYRRDEKKTDKIRAERVEKRRMYLTLEVEEVEFHDFSDRLRVQGVIREGPQDLGAHHTFNFEAGSELEVRKELWTVGDQQLVKEAVEATKRPLVTFVAIEEGDATIATLRQYGVKENAHISFNVPGKQYKTKGDRKEFFNEVIDALSQVYDGNDPLIIVGPGFTKEELSTIGRETRPELFGNSHLIASGHAGMVGINDAIRSGSTVKVLEQSRVAEETTQVERLFSEIRKDGLYGYGKDEVKKQLESGAVDTLLVADVSVREGSFDDLLDLASQMGARIMIVSTVHDAGKRLKSLGGIAALLRYKNA